MQEIIPFLRDSEGNYSNKSALRSIHVNSCETCVCCHRCQTHFHPPAIILKINATGFICKSLAHAHNGNQNWMTCKRPTCPSPSAHNDRNIKRALRLRTMHHPKRTHFYIIHNQLLRARAFRLKLLSGNCIQCAPTRWLFIRSSGII